jgi:hypothetical protein
MRTEYTNSWGKRIIMTDCVEYWEDPFICDDVGEPKGQCGSCGHKWYEHELDALPLIARTSALEIQDREFSILRNK